MPSAGRWVVAVVVILGLTLPAAAVARPVDAVQSAAKLRSIGSLPQHAFAGDEFRLTVRVRNDSRKAARPRLVVSLRKRKNGSGGRVVAARRVGKLNAGASKRYRIKVELPRGLAAGRYYVSVCARTAGRPSCRVADRRLRVMKRSQKPPQAAGSEAGRQARRRPRPHRVAHGGDAHSSTAAGLDALKDAGKSVDFKVAEAAAVGGRVHRGQSRELPAVVFLNTSGDILSDNEQSAFEHYFQQGGGFVGIHSAIATEPDWTFMDKPARHARRARHPAGQPRSRRSRRPRSRSPTASTTRASRWPSVSGHRRASTTPTSEVRGFQHVLATVDEDTYEEQDGPPPARPTTTRSCGARTSRAAARSTRAWAITRRRSSNANVRQQPRGRDQVGDRPVGPDLQRLRRHRARQLQAGQDLGAAEPERADRLRPAPRRAHHPDRARRPGPPARPRGRHHRHDRQPGPVPAGALHPQRGRALRPRRGRRTSRRTSGCTCTTRRRS